MATSHTKLLTPTIAAKQRAKPPVMTPGGTEATRPIPVSAVPRLAEQMIVPKNLAPDAVQIMAFLDPFFVFLSN